jgi:hypothetical protein
MYLLHYVEGCTPKLKEFKTKKALSAFIKKFKVDTEDNWLDYVIKGKVTEIYDPYYASYLKNFKGTIND